MVGGLTAAVYAQVRPIPLAYLNTAAVVRFVDGTAAAPAIGFTNDAGTDTGWYLIGANNIGQTAGGTLRWDWNTTRILSTIGLQFTDNTVDIGADGATRPQDVILAGLFATNNRPTVTVDAVTTFAVASSYTVLACTGAETVNTITGGITGTVVWLEHSDADCTIADDDDPTAANAVNLTGVATNDVGATAKVIGLIYNGTSWLQIFESAN